MTITLPANNVKRKKTNKLIIFGKQKYCVNDKNSQSIHNA